MSAPPHVLAPRAGRRAREETLTPPRPLREMTPSSSASTGPRRGPPARPVPPGKEPRGRGGSPTGKAWRVPRPPPLAEERPAGEAKAGGLAGGQEEATPEELCRAPPPHLPCHNRRHLPQTLAKTPTLARGGPGGLPRARLREGIRVRELPRERVHPPSPSRSPKVAGRQCARASFLFLI